jgi:hypothetical protein
MDRAMTAGLATELSEDRISGVGMVPEAFLGPAVDRRPVEVARDLRPEADRKVRDIGKWVVGGFVAGAIATSVVAGISQRLHSGASVEPASAKVPAIHGARESRHGRR